MFECARYLASREHDVHVFANQWESDGTIQYHHVPMRNQPFFLRGSSFFQECTAALQGKQFDVLNSHGCVCPTGGVHWIQSVHRSWLERSRSFRSPLTLSRWRQRLNPLHPVLLRLEAKHFRERRYKKIIATTSAVREDLGRFYGVPAEDVTVIPNGFSPTEFNPERRMERREEMRARLGLKTGEIALLFVAHELERKGYPTILSALQELKRKDLRLLVVGRPAQRLVMEQAAHFGVESQVIPCGPTTDVAAFHAAADIFVLPTQYEAFCLAILEALGSGLPVVTTRIPGAFDAIQPGANGFLIDDPKSGPQLAAALAPLLDENRRAEISTRVPETVEQYQWPSVLERYEAVLLENCG